MGVHSKRPRMNPVGGRRPAATKREPEPGAEWWCAPPGPPRGGARHERARPRTTGGGIGSAGVTGDRAVRPNQSTFMARASVRCARVRPPFVRRGRPRCSACGGLEQLRHDSRFPVVLEQRQLLSDVHLLHGARASALRSEKLATVQEPLSVRPAPVPEDQTSRRSPEGMQAR